MIYQPQYFDSNWARPRWYESAIADAFGYVLRMLVGNEWVKTCIRFLKSDGLFRVLPVYVLVDGKYKEITQTYPKLNILIDGEFVEDVETFNIVDGEFKPSQMSFVDDQGTLHIVE